MKPLDLIQLGADFKVAMAGTTIPAEVKLRVAEEVLHSLPPVALCMAFPASREWLGTMVQAEIDTLKAQENDRTNQTEAASEKSAAQSETKAVRPRQARKEPLGK